MNFGIEKKRVVYLILFLQQKTGVASRPEMSVDLNGALIDRGDKVSSRKNVYIISTILGLQVLIQNDSTQQADSWLLAIQATIKNLVRGNSLVLDESVCSDLLLTNVLIPK